MKNAFDRFMFAVGMIFGVHEEAAKPTQRRANFGMCAHRVINL